MVQKTHNVEPNSAVNMPKSKKQVSDRKIKNLATKAYGSPSRKRDMIKKVVGIALHYLL